MKHIALNQISSTFQQYEFEKKLFRHIIRWEIGTFIYFRVHILDPLIQIVFPFYGWRFYIILFHSKLNISRSWITIGCIKQVQSQLCSIYCFKVTHIVCEVTFEKWENYFLEILLAFILCNFLSVKHLAKSSYYAKKRRSKKRNKSTTYMGGNKHVIMI